MLDDRSMNEDNSADSKTEPEIRPMTTQQQLWQPSGSELFNQVFPALPAGPPDLFDYSNFPPESSTQQPPLSMLEASGASSAGTPTTTIPSTVITAHATQADLNWDGSLEQPTPLSSFETCVIPVTETIHPLVSGSAVGGLEQVRQNKHQLSHGNQSTDSFHLRDLIIAAKMDLITMATEGYYETVSL